MAFCSSVTYVACLIAVEDFWVVIDCLLMCSVESLRYMTTFCELVVKRLDLQIKVFV
jgi:hypothetical protein